MLGGVDETTGYGQSIMDSIKGIAIGGMMFVGAIVLLFWNEGRAVYRAKDLAEGRKNCVEIQADKVDAANEGKLVHVAGMASTEETLTDPMFGVTQPKALRLKRTVEMYQYREKSKKKKKRSRTYYVVKEWSDSPIDSSSFKGENQKYKNPPMPCTGDGWQAKDVALGAFKLSPQQIGMIGGWKALKPDQVKIDDRLASQMTGLVITPQGLYCPAKSPIRVGSGPRGPNDGETGKDDKIAKGSEPGEPTVGDVRIRFEVVEAHDVSTIAKQSGDSFIAYPTSTGSTLLELRDGKMGKDEMFSKAEAENNMMTWILRLVGWIVMGIGISMFFGPIVAIIDIIPFLGDIVEVGVMIFAAIVSLVISLVVIAVAWLFYRPLLGVLLLLAAGGLIFALKQMGSAKKAAPVAEDPGTLE